LNSDDRHTVRSEKEWARRFGGVDRLYGAGSWQCLARSQVTLIGLGGVGSWTAEALARSGVGRLTLIDLDDVCVTNTNRQLPALTGTIGMSKAEVLEQRINEINPEAEVTPVLEFLTAGNAERLLADPTDVIVDAVDRMAIKALILHTAVQLHRPVVTVGSSGGKRMAHLVQIADLGASGGDELLKQVRKRLRRTHGWSRGEGQRYGVTAVFSTEPRVFPQEDGSVCATRESEESLRMDCATGLGAACHVTATFGMVLAQVVIEQLLASAEHG